MQALLRERLFYVITPAIKYPHSIGLYSRSTLSGQPKNMAIIHSAISYVSARDLRLFNCRINNRISGEALQMEQGAYQKSFAQEFERIINR